VQSEEDTYASLGQYPTEGNTRKQFSHRTYDQISSKPEEGIYADSQQLKLVKNTKPEQKSEGNIATSNYALYNPSREILRRTRKGNGKGKGKGKGNKTKKQEQPSKFKLSGGVSTRGGKRTINHIKTKKNKLKLNTKYTKRKHKL
jgi:hypothetical protein